MTHALRRTLSGTAAVVLLAGCGASGPAGGGAVETAPVAERFSYGAFSATYEGASHTTLDQMGQTLEFGVRFYLTAEAEVAGAAARLSMTVDSIPLLAMQGATEADAAAAAGMTFTGILSPDGEILDFHGGEDATSTFIQEMRTGFERFFPRLPANGAAPGDTWTDSLQTTTGGDGVDILVESHTRSEAVDWVDWDGVRALYVVRVSDYVLSGTGSQMGMEFTVEGTGVRREHRYLGANGAYLGGIAADTSNFAVVTATGMEIPMLQTQADTLRIVR